MLIKDSRLLRSLVGLFKISTAANYCMRQYKFKNDYNVKPDCDNDQYQILNLFDRAFHATAHVLGRFTEAQAQ